jgi:putative endonuclease
MTDREQLGAEGERLAVHHLQRKGYRIAERNYRCPLGEVDLIALQGEELCFVEVKTRRSDEFESPVVNVTPDKRRRIRRIARYYLSRKRIADTNVRFDVIAIVLPEGGEPKLEHYENAF